MTDVDRLFADLMFPCGHGPASECRRCAAEKSLRSLLAYASRAPAPVEARTLNTLHVANVRGLLLAAKQAFEELIEETVATPAAAPATREDEGAAEMLAFAVAAAGGEVRIDKASLLVRPTLERSDTPTQIVLRAPAAAPAEAMLRPEVRAFAEAMEAALRLHDRDRGERGWEDSSTIWLLERVAQERSELSAAVARRYRTLPNTADRREATDRVLAEAADVANFAMMVADVCCDLRARPPAPAASPPPGEEAHGKGKDGTCCSCGYEDAEETPCPKQEDAIHCVHWWEGVAEENEPPKPAPSPVPPPGERDACIDCGASIHDHHVDGQRLVHPRAAPPPGATDEGKTE